MPRTQMQHRAAIVRRMNGRLREPGFQLPPGDPAAGTGIIAVLPGDSVRYLLKRLAEYPGGAIVVAESGDGLVMTPTMCVHVDG